MYELELLLLSSTNDWSYTSLLLIGPTGMHKDSFTLMVSLKSHRPLHAEEI